MKRLALPDRAAFVRQPGLKNQVPLPRNDPRIWRKMENNQEWLCHWVRLSGWLETVTAVAEPPHSKIREEHRQECLARKAPASSCGRYKCTAVYFPALRRSFGVASQISSPLGGTKRFSSIRATPDFFRAVR